MLTDCEIRLLLLIQKSPMLETIHGVGEKLSSSYWFIQGVNRKYSSQLLEEIEQLQRQGIY